MVDQLKDGEIPNYLHGINALLDIKKMLDSLTPESIEAHSNKIKSEYALTEKEQQDRESYFNAIAESQAIKNEILSIKSQNDLAMIGINSDKKKNLEDAKINADKLKELTDKEAAIKSAQDKLDAFSASLKDKELFIDNKFKVLSDLQSQHNAREAAISQKEAEILAEKSEIKAKKDEISSIISRMK